MKITEWIVKEGRIFGILATYFLVCYSMIMFLKKLILAQYHIDSIGYGGAIVGALISAKVIMILEHTPFARAFHRAPPYRRVIFEVILYTFFAFVVLYLEKVIELRHQAGGIEAAFETVWQHRDFHVLAATLICAGFAFLVYSVFAAIDRRLGHGALWRLFVTPRTEEEIAEREAHKR